MYAHLPSVPSTIFYTAMVNKIPPYSFCQNILLHTSVQLLHLQTHLGDLFLKSTQHTSLFAHFELLTIMNSLASKQNGSELQLQGKNITNNLSRANHFEATAKITQQVLYLLRTFRKFDMSPMNLTNFYRCTRESVMSGCTPAWYGSISAQNCKKLLRVEDVAQSHHTDQNPHWARQCGSKSCPMLCSAWKLKTSDK